LVSADKRGGMTLRPGRPPARGLSSRLICLFYRSPPRSVTPPGGPHRFRAYRERRVPLKEDRRPHLGATPPPRWRRLISGYHGWRSST
jgi:hypothetical protein